MEAAGVSEASLAGKPGREAAPYRRIAEHFRARIASGELKQGDRLPTVREVASTWDVSRQTADKALSALQSEGLVRTGGRAGTIVDVQQSHSEEIAVVVSVGKSPVAVESVEVTEAADNVAKQLGVAPGTSILILRLHHPQEAAD
jgi:DNA-binding GntR family transcriptional regulator